MYIIYIFFVTSPQTFHRKLGGIMRMCDDGMMHHLIDSLAWKIIDSKWPNFSNVPHNVQLEMTVDGFNPFGNLSSAYSFWPIVLAIYNHPPW